VLALADWLRSWQVPAVVMEATGDYWKGPFYRLEAEGFDCVLADARQVKHLPGRPKHDLGDSRWLAACFERGAVTPCFVATEEFRVIRLHTRYRRDLTGDRSRERQRAEKLLESAAVKLSSVVTDLHGVTGRDIMDHLFAGERTPKVLAQLARRRARAKIPRLEEALEGAEFFTPAHAALLAVMLERSAGCRASAPKRRQATWATCGLGAMRRPDVRASGIGRRIVRVRSMPQTRGGDQGPRRRSGVR
jgi:transposase